jgi:hypothetical protein
VVQQTADPVSVTVPNNGVVSLDANRVPGQSFAVNIAAPGNSSAYVYFNGYGSCYASRLT